MSKSGTFEQELDLAWLLKVRTVVARIGEMDLARWWNSTGQLGPQGASVLRRGLPRTHYFAQARSVCMVAATRCAQIFDPPGSVTLWRLTDPLEERLETLWEGSEAEVIDEKYVKFKDEKLSYNDWGKKVTVWSTIGIYDWAMKGADTLAELRDRKMNEQRLATQVQGSTA
jgi:hypothetical protein